MPKYDYGCSKDNTHPVVEKIHRMMEEPVYRCEVCGAEMDKLVVRNFSFYQNPMDTLLDWCDYNWRRKKAGAEAWSPDKVNRPNNPYPQSQFHARRHKNDSKKD